jgi:peptidyl-prolyl cis-trans isomerase D
MPNESGNKPALHKKHVARLERERRQSRLILYAFFVIVASVLLLLAYGIVDTTYLQLKKPVATVGDVEILTEDFEARVRFQRQQLLGQHNQFVQYQQLFGMDTSQQLQQIEAYLNNPEFLGQTVLDQMISEEVIRQEAAKRGITVSADELDKYIQTEFRYFPNGTFTPTVTPTEMLPPEAPAGAFDIVTITPTANPVTATPTFTPTLDLTATIAPSQTPTPTLAATATAGPTSTPLPTATPYTLEGFQSEYVRELEGFTKHGLTEADYRELMEVQILQEKLQEVVLADVDDTEVQVWARHILVSDATVAITLIERLKAGEDFAALALEFSEDTGSAALGGDLGWFGSGAMVPEFEAAAFALQNPGDITLEPVQSQFGFHIIQLIARQERPLDASAYEQARSTAFSQWLDAARLEYNVEQFDFWKARVPTEPNFITQATEAVSIAQTENARLLTETVTATPE